MKILISCDMEGTCGLTHFGQVLPPEIGQMYGVKASPDYEWARRLLTKEVNAAVEGAFAGGATEVYVNESHDGMRNLLPEELDPRARLINGSDKPLSMMQGADLGVDAIFCTGYHASANTPGAVMAHTYSLTVQQLRLNGARVGELGLNAALAGYYGVPVVLVTGDDKVVAEAKELLGEQVVGVQVKQGIRQSAAIQLHPSEARRLITAGATEALGRVKDAAPMQVSAPICLELDLMTVAQADHAESFPGVERTGRTQVSFTAPDMLKAAQGFFILLHLCGGLL